jgi:hypothetical protein
MQIYIPARHGALCLRPAAQVIHCSAEHHQDVPSAWGGAQTTSSWSQHHRLSGRPSLCTHPAPLFISAPEQCIALRDLSRSIVLR